jgi:hypothetical protein
MLRKSDIEEAISFQKYLELTENIISHPSPPPPYDEPKILKYTFDNWERMKRLMHTLSIEPKLYNLLRNNQRNMMWVVLSEPWCGDAAQIVPALAAFADVSSNISLRILLSDAHPQVMNQYLTEGSRSIPKLICIDSQTWEELGTWGPRPKYLQEMVMAQKDDPTLSFGEKVRQVHAWYEENKTRDIQVEFIELLKRWNNIL